MNKVFIKKIFFTFIILIFCAVLITAPVFAWFTEIKLYKPDITGTSIINYFAGGTGTESDPYIINDKKHIHNLAWLQALGLLQDKKYYFRLGADIDMQGIAVPPIGTEAKPFIGNFDGNGYTISNLFVSNNKSELKINCDITQLDLGKLTGFFGSIDCIEPSYLPEKAGKAYGFYLENVNITNIHKITKNQLRHLFNNIFDSYEGFINRFPPLSSVF
jgi:hypothetical protein